VRCEIHEVVLSWPRAPCHFSRNDRTPIARYVNVGSAGEGLDCAYLTAAQGKRQPG
jgi:hypothetical protein